MRLYRFIIGASFIATLLGLALSARAQSVGTRYVHNGKEITKFEAMKILLETGNKANVEKCSEQYMDERRGTLKNK